MTNVNNDACGVAWREQNGESGVRMTHPGGRGSGVKKLIRLPSGSRNSIDRLPQG
jgi:hypothetical protein